jgi:sugar lactone lactonase YvrE
VEIDLATDRVLRRIVIDPSLAPPKSFVNDARIDARRGVAYVTETGIGGVLVVDLQSGRQRRALEAGDWIDVAPAGPTVEGITIPQSARARAPRTPDGVALSADGEWLYLQAHPWLAPETYRVRTAVLRDDRLSPAEAARKVERVARTVFADGIQLAPTGDLYLTDVEHNGVARLREGATTVELLVTDPRLSWPDSIGIGPDGALYLPVPQFHRRASVAGSERSAPPYAVFRVDPPRRGSTR